MNSWSHLNARGKLVAVFCGLNVALAIFSAIHGDVACFFNLLCGMICGVATYSPKCIKNECKNECKKDSEAL